MLRFDGFVQSNLRTASWPDHEFNSLTPEQREEVYQAIRAEEAYWTDIAINKHRQFEITWWFAHRSWVPEEVIVSVGEEVVLLSAMPTPGNISSNRYILDLQDRYVTSSKGEQQTYGPANETLLNNLLPWISVAEVIQKFGTGPRIYHEYNLQGSGSMQTSFTKLRFTLPIGQARELQVLPQCVRDLILMPATAVAAKTLRQILEQYGEIIAWRLEHIGNQATLQVQLQLASAKKYLRPPNNHEELYPGVTVTAVAVENRMDVCDVDLVIALTNPQVAISLPPGNRIEYRDAVAPDPLTMNGADAYEERIRNSPADNDIIRVDEGPPMDMTVRRRRFGPVRPTDEVIERLRTLLRERPMHAMIPFAEHFHAEELAAILIERHNIGLSEGVIQEINRARSTLEAERRARRTVPQYTMADISVVDDPVYPAARVTPEDLTNAGFLETGTGASQADHIHAIERSQRLGMAIQQQTYDENIGALRLNPNALPHDVASDRPGVSRVQTPARSREANTSERSMDSQIDWDQYTFWDLTWELLKRPFRYLWSKFRRKYTVPETEIRETDLVTTPSNQLYSPQNVTAVIGTAQRGAAQPGRTSLSRLFALDDALRNDQMDSPSGHQAHREQYLINLDRPELESMLRDQRFTAHHAVIRQVLSERAADTQS